MLGARFLLCLLALTSATEAWEVSWPRLPSWATHVFHRGVKPEKAPQLELPWGIWEAEKYSSDKKVIYHFKNVRFGAEPQRFSAPSFPDVKSNQVVRDGRRVACPQVEHLELEKNRQCPKAPEGQPLVQTEDCLLLDIYAPVDAFKPGAEPLPVIVWFFGGAFAWGSKDDGLVLYSGRSILEASGHKVIFIAGNYRVGAFGWLAGNYMQRVGTPNAGLHDQSLLLQWVQDHVHKVGGDRDRVSAWGQSAGGGSIMHHLIREDGERDPLFKSFVAWSPGFEWAWDNTVDGELDLIYGNFSRHVGCVEKYDIECLRSASFENLAEANQKLFTEAREQGVLPVGPAVDGDWVRTMPPVALSQGKHWKDISGAIVSHTSNEAEGFVPDVKDQAAFDDLLKAFLPGDLLKEERDAIVDRFDCVGEFNGDFEACMGVVIDQLVFTCNTRFLIEAFPKNTYAMQYGFPNDGLAYHGSDMIPLFYSKFLEVHKFLLKNFKELSKLQAFTYTFALMSTVSPTYRKFFSSFATLGHPNDFFTFPKFTWPQANGDGDAVSGVVKAMVKMPFYGHIENQMNTRSKCSFWLGIAKSIDEKMRQANENDELQSFVSIRNASSSNNENERLHPNIDPTSYSTAEYRSGTDLDSPDMS